jgi:hypothetical protein
MLSHMTVSENPAPTWSSSSLCTNWISSGVRELLRGPCTTTALMVSFGQGLPQSAGTPFSYSFKVSANGWLIHPAGLMGLLLLGFSPRFDGLTACWVVLEGCRTVSMLPLGRCCWGRCLCAAFSWVVLSCGGHITVYSAWIKEHDDAWF